MQGARKLGAAFACALGACTLLTACLPQPIACPMIAAAPIVTIHVTPERAATLDPTSLTGEACQNGQCHGGPLTLADDSGPNTQLGAKRAQIMMILTDSPIDLTVTGTNTSGKSIGSNHVRFTPRVEYPWGRQCQRVLIAEATLDNQGLYAG
ncbi:hypothetical protein [Sinomonas sp. P47F7]|uniref:hypothetical protein n=1 Tax=Sinomonas sp. P47F7 TaxID=3410987 RepID=UPI003BF4C397